MNSWWTRAKAAFQRLRYTEPALLRARVVQVLALGTILGFTIPGVVDYWVGITFTALGILAPYYQGRRTRADVWSQQTVDDLTALAGLFPGLVDRAKDLLGKGISLDIVRAQLEQLALTDDTPGQHAADR